MYSWPGCPGHVTRDTVSLSLIWIRSGCSFQPPELLIHVICSGEPVTVNFHLYVMHGLGWKWRHISVSMTLPPYGWSTLYEENEHFELRFLDECEFPMLIWLWLDSSWLFITEPRNPGERIRWRAVLVKRTKYMDFSPWTFDTDKCETDFKDRWAWCDGGLIVWTENRDGKYPWLCDKHWRWVSALVR